MKWSGHSFDKEEDQYWKIKGNIIARARRSHGNGMSYDKRKVVFSQKKLGDIVGLSRCSIANIEGGRQRITCYLFDKIMEALK